MLILLAVSLVFAAAGAPAADTAETIALRNARQASEALLRSNRVMHAWLKRTDPVTGLLPRAGNDPRWTVSDSAADLYPFFVLAAYFTEPSLYENEMRHILRQETLLTTRAGRLSDHLLPGGKGFAFPKIDMDRVIFGSSEYAKDGLVPITELLGETPWYYRMRGIATDIVAQAPYESRRGRLPANTTEVNGNMLQTLSRLCWKTGTEEYLKQVVAIADLYLLDMLPLTGGIPADAWDIEVGKPLQATFRFSDHGNEIAGGLSEALMLVKYKRPEKFREYLPPFTRMMDRLLEVGRNPDGVWITAVSVPDGKVADARHAHCWGYMFNAVYTAYLLTGEERYRKAVTDGIEGVTRKPEYLFDDTGAGRKWGANAYSDSLEGALVLLNRLPNSAAEAQVDLATRKFFDRQQADGIIEDWHGDGNFVRTALMYAFWKTQGAYVEPWSRRVHVGAAPESAGVLIHLSAESPWQGRLRFDHPRYRDHWNMAVNCPRLNEFPEWFTVEQDRPYLVRIGDGPARKYLGADLVSGIPLALNGGETIVIRVAEAGNPPYGRSP